MTKDNRLLRFAAAFLLCFGLMLSVLAVNAGAVSAYIWDGTTELQAGRTYYVVDTVKVRRDVIVPEGTKLSVRDGATLKISAAGSLTVNGELSAAIGGTIINYGNLNIKKGGRLNIYGLFQSSVSAQISISGSVTIYNRGVFETSSASKIYKNAQIYLKGIMSFYKSSDVKLSGTITTVEHSTLELRGIMAVSVSGMIDVSGHLTVGTASNVRCSGKLILNECATYTRFKTITLTKSGEFLDSRPTYEYQDMTVDILIDEPDVLRKGIDVSWAQGDSVDWAKVKEAGVEFAIIRAARGYISEEKPLAEDVCFRRNIEEAQKYGIDVGVYFYSYASTVAEARAEAEFFVETIKDYQIQYPVILDMEEQYQGHIGKKKLTNMIDAFFEVLMENGYFPMFYSYKSWIEAYLDMSTLDKYAVWLAQVSDEVTYDGGYYIWQYSFTGKVSGIPNDVDLNYSYKDWPTIFRKYHLNNMS
ncbi:MAG: hypothetical protein IK093_12715 [Ruminiclostridium sp.]|nr:hypothetical protein [Ruminiclostridium sp.]